MADSTYENILCSVNQLSKNISNRAKHNKSIELNSNDKKIILEISDYCKDSRVYWLQLKERMHQREQIETKELYKSADDMFLDIIKKILDCDNKSERFRTIVLWFSILNDVIDGKIKLGGAN